MLTKHFGVICMGTGWENSFLFLLSNAFKAQRVFVLES